MSKRLSSTQELHALIRVLSLTITHLLPIGPALVKLNCQLCKRLMVILCHSFSPTIDHGEILLCLILLCGKESDSIRSPPTSVFCNIW